MDFTSDLKLHVTIIGDRTSSYVKLRHKIYYLPAYQNIALPERHACFPSERITLSSEPAMPSFKYRYLIVVEQDLPKSEFRRALAVPLVISLVIRVARMPVACLRVAVFRVIWWDCWR